MASISGFSNLNNYSFLFSNTSSNKTSSLDLFSNSGSNPLGDYALIKSGVYKKLLNAYYQKNGTTDKTTSTTDGEEDSTQTLTTVKSAAEDLKDSVEELGKSSVYKTTGVDKDGNIVGIRVTDCSNETPGLGQNSSTSWNEQYVGMAKGDSGLSVVKDGSGSTDNGTVNAISGATITSRAVTRAVNGALDFIASLSE